MLPRTNNPLTKSSNSSSSSALDSGLVAQYQNLAKQSNGRISWNESTNSFDPYIMNSKARYKDIQKEHGLKKFFDTSFFYLNKISGVQGLRDNIDFGATDSRRIIALQKKTKSQFENKGSTVNPLRPLYQSLHDQVQNPLKQFFNALQVAASVLLIQQGLPRLFNLSKFYLQRVENRIPSMLERRLLPLRPLRFANAEQVARFFPEAECPICYEGFHPPNPTAEERLLNEPAIHCREDRPIHLGCLNEWRTTQGGVNVRCPGCNEPLFRGGRLQQGSQRSFSQLRSKFTQLQRQHDLTLRGGVNEIEMVPPLRRGGYQSIPEHPHDD
jgi:hypothetical protein